MVVTAGVAVILDQVFDRHVYYFKCIRHANLSNSFAVFLLPGLPKPYSTGRLPTSVSEPLVELADPRTSVVRGFHRSYRLKLWRVASSLSTVTGLLSAPSLRRLWPSVEVPDVTNKAAPRRRCRACRSLRPSARATTYQSARTRRRTDGWSRMTSCRRKRPRPSR